jgi:hypothetical protein
MSAVVPAIDLPPRWQAAGLRMIQESGIAASNASTNIVHATMMQIACAADKP